MDNKYRLGIAILGLLFAAFMVWYFSNIVVYLIVSAVISMIGHPLVRKFDKIKLWRFKFPHALSAVLTLLILLSTFVGFIWFVVPMIVSQAQMISSIHVSDVMNHFSETLESVKESLIQFNILNADETIESAIETQLNSMIDLATFSSLFSSLISTTGSFMMGTFSIIFISFFFLHDEHMFENMLILIMPEKYTNEVHSIFEKTKQLLSRYFLGLMIEILSMMTLITIALTILGIKNALIIGFLGGLMNIIPYLGPLIGASIGVFFGLASTLSLGLYDQIGFYTLSILGSFAVANMIDNFLLQPLIYSNSVKARPIEIFIVIIMAGSFAGVPGMILAIPAYTVIRIIAKEFLKKSRLVNKLTEKI